LKWPFFAEAFYEEFNKRKKYISFNVYVTDIINVKIINYDFSVIGKKARIFLSVMNQEKQYTLI
jgi:hypothetical protein